MSLILIDGMEDMSSVVQASSTISIRSPGRNGNCLRGTNGAAWKYDLPVAQQLDTLTLGFAVLFSAAPAVTNFISLRSDAGVTTHVTVQLLANGSLRIVSAGILATSAAGLIAASTWYYVELQCKLHDTTGFVTLRLNGTTVASATNVDTKNGGTKTVFDQLRVDSLSTAGSTTDYDDLYLMAGTGDSFLGDITVATLYPNGNGNANQWVGSDGNSTDNYLLVDEVGAPVTTDHTKSSTVGQIDQYTLTDLATAGTILGVCHQATMALAAAGSQTFQLVNRRTTDNVSPTLTATSTTYAGFHYVLALDPETGAAWTIANVNALQTGVKVV